ncbi:glutathione peroxidase 1 isoform X2 [Puma concolor]|uniref:Glutathione peroxidase 1 n=1 Tax=Puma concolor TaxID=9696 RepID=A0A6P6H9I2_PUMCO|nr:glutathione peroxidase 1 isoform X2 [Puma concolor]
MCAAPLAAAALAAAAPRSVYSFSARPLAGGEPMSLGSLRGKENAKNEEILNSLKYVRPGGGFEPNFTLFEKCEVNGAQAHPLFAFLRQVLPAPSDDATALMTDPKFITWSPVCRNDVAWNFEKFLVGPDGVPVRRYSRRFPTIDIEPDIEALLSQGPSCA